MMGVSSIDNDEIAGAMRTLATAPANTGACVITIDHLPKSAEARSTGYAIGGTGKKRPIRGAYIYCEVKLQPAPDQLGHVMLRIEKDSLGELRKTCTGKYIGDFTLDSRTPNQVIATVGREHSPFTTDGVMRPTYVMEQVSRLIEDMPGINRKSIETSKTFKGGARTRRAAIERLLEDTYITVADGPHGAKNFHSVKPYRQVDDEAE